MIASAAALRSPPTLSTRTYPYVTVSAFAPSASPPRRPLPPPSPLHARVLRQARPASPNAGGSRPELPWPLSVTASLAAVSDSFLGRCQWGTLAASMRRPGGSRPELPWPLSPRCPILAAKVSHRPKAPSQRPLAHLAPCRSYPQRQTAVDTNALASHPLTPVTRITIWRSA